ncbi:MAG TPA: glycosyltransferase family 39 protein [Candidatus Binatus sp.]|nr:glycosyltransferase family 39 protein [Candidatus Binatus sp.]
MSVSAPVPAQSPGRYGASPGRASGPRTLLLAVGLAAVAMVIAGRSIDADIYEGSEAREALVAREMVETGDWILPLWNGTVVPSKPPLFHWLVATASHLAGTGVTERTLRAPSVVAAGLVVLLVFLAGRAWAGENAGVLAALILATSPQFLKEAVNGRVDMTLCAAVTGAQLAFVRSMRGGGRGTPLVLAACLAVAMMVKGPVGPGLVVLPALVFALSERRLGDALRLARPLPLLLFVVLAGAWYLLAYLHRGEDFVARQVIAENGEALLGGTRYPYRSALYYLGPLVLAGLPWTLLLPWAGARAWRGDPARRYCLLWAAAGFVFFSLAPLKRTAYLLPLRPALALLIGWWLAEVAHAETPRRRGMAFAVAAAALAAIAGVAVAGGALAVRYGVAPSARLIALGAAYEVDVPTYLRHITAACGEIVALGFAMAVAGGLAARALAHARWRPAALAVAAAFGAAALLVHGVFVPARAMQKSVRPFALAVRARVPPEEPLALLTSDEEIPFIFYVGRRVPVLGEVGPRAPELGPGYYVLDQQKWRAWKSPAGWEEILVGPHVFSRHRRDLVLVRRR